MTVDEFVFRIVRLVIGGVRSDNIDDRRIGPARIVQRGDAIGEAAANVEESEGRRPLHAGVTVCSASYDVLLQT